MKLVLHLREAFEVSLRYANAYMKQMVVYKPGAQRRGMVSDVNLEVGYV